jgi:two-component system, cell cycle sensor histidine kinase and response regulator CckA
MIDNPEAENGSLPDGLKILVADDEERLRFVLTMMLEELGAEVVAVDDCEKALALYGAPGERFDVVMLDLRMKGIGGAGAFREILARDPAARIVLSSGIRPDDDLLDELRHHGCAFIEKPFDIGLLARVLGGLVRRKP